MSGVQNLDLVVLVVHLIPDQAAAFAANDFLYVPGIAIVPADLDLVFRTAFRVRAGHSFGTVTHRFFPPSFFLIYLSRELSGLQFHRLFMKKPILRTG